MANTWGKAYGLSVLSPIKTGNVDGISYADIVRDRLNDWGVNELSPMAKVPNTYLCRYFVLDDVFSQSLAGPDFFYTPLSILSLGSNAGSDPNSARMRALAAEDHLKNKYIVFTANFYGDLDEWLTDMWHAISPEIKRIWEFCWGFDRVMDAAAFVDYIKKCQLETTLFFSGSTEDSLAEQLKGLYLKQELTRFAADHQGWPAAKLQEAYQAFIKRVDPTNLAGPSWKPGQSSVSQ